LKNLVYGVKSLRIWNKTGDETQLG
jgi:hypothetical protein